MTEAPGNPPAPGLEYCFTVEAEVAAAIEIGRSFLGERRTIPILGGKVFGPRLEGIILPGGVDYQLLRSDELAEIHARYIIETPRGARIYVENAGIRRAPAPLIARLKRGEPVDPSLVYFRTTPRFECADPDCAWMMENIFICAGARHPTTVRLAFFRVG